MPETSMNEDDSLPLGEHDIRSARQIRYVQPEPIAHSVQQRAYEQFRFCVRATNATHVPTAALFCESVDHGLSSRVNSL